MKRLSLYLFVGGSAFVIEYFGFLLFYLIIFHESSMLLAQILSFILGLGFSYLGNRYITFKTHQSSYLHDAAKQLSLYVTLAIVNLLISSFVIMFLASYAGLSPIFAKLATMALITAWNLILYSRIIFRNKPVSIS